MKFLPLILILALIIPSSCHPIPPTEPETVVEYVKAPKEIVIVKEIPYEVVRVVKVDRELRDFTSTKEFKKVIGRYADGLTVLDWDCEPLVRAIVEEIRIDGYYVDTEIVSAHMVIKGFVVNKWSKAICLYDFHTGRFREIHKISGGYRFPQYINVQPESGKPARPPKPDKPDKPKK